jgi:hypothetical protein
MLPSILQLLPLLALLLILVDPKFFEVHVATVERRAVCTSPRALEFKEFRDVARVDFGVRHELGEVAGEGSLSDAWLFHVVADLLADVIAGVVDFYFFILLPVKVDVSQIRSRWGFVFGLLGRVLGLS